MRVYQKFVGRLTFKFCATTLRKSQPTVNCSKYFSHPRYEQRTRHHSDNLQPPSSHHDHQAMPSIICTQRLTSLLLVTLLAWVALAAPTIRITRALGALQIRSGDPNTSTAVRFNSSVSQPDKCSVTTRWPQTVLAAWVYAVISLMSRPGSVAGFIFGGVLQIVQWTIAFAHIEIDKGSGGWISVTCSATVMITIFSKFANDNEEQTEGRGKNWTLAWWLFTMFLEMFFRAFASIAEL